LGIGSLEEIPLNLAMFYDERLTCERGDNMARDDGRGMTATAEFILSEDLVRHLLHKDLYQVVIGDITVEGQGSRFSWNL
jgi:hypothetical protein